MNFELTFTTDTSNEYQRIDAVIEITETDAELIAESLAYEFDRISDLVQDTEVDFDTRNLRWDVTWVLEPVHKSLNEVLDDAILTHAEGEWEVADDPNIQVIAADTSWSGAVNVRVTLMARKIS